MKIDPKVASAALHSLSAAPPSASKAGAAGRSKPEIQASGQLHRFNSSQVGGDFDAERVATIRAAISDGSYQVNGSRIADGLLRNVGDLLG